MNKELRFNGDGLRVEERESDGATAPVIVGHAAVFDSLTTLSEDRFMQVKEVVRAGAFRNAIEANQDVRALINHDANLVLGRTASGTVKIAENIRGLEVTISPPDTQAARDLLTLIKRGDINGMSFAFSPRPGGEIVTRKDSEDGKRVIERQLTDLNLYDVSVVTYPAYEQTDAAMRSNVSRLLAESLGQRKLTDAEKELIAWAKEQRDFNFNMTLEQAMKQGR